MSIIKTYIVQLGTPQLATHPIGIVSTVQSPTDMIRAMLKRQLGIPVPRSAWVHPRLGLNDDTLWDIWFDGQIGTIPDAVVKIHFVFDSAMKSKYIEYIMKITQDTIVNAYTEAV